MKKPRCYIDPNAILVKRPHPSALEPDELLKQCEFRHGSVSGPGGQHRNRNATELAIDWTRNVKLSVPRNKAGEVTLATLEGQLARALQALGGQPPRLVRAL